MEFSIETIFLSIANMSITASYVILLMVAVRLLLRKAPKIFSYSLWAVVFFRLVCPFSFSSPFSFLKLITGTAGKMEPIPLHIGQMAQPKVDLGVQSVNTAINGILPPVTLTASANPMQIFLFILSILWGIGMLTLVTYSIVSYLRLKRKVSTAMMVHKGVYECEGIRSPFVLGIIAPKIYLPLGLEEKEKSYILKHEQTHIRRLDYLIKPFAFFILCVHWFNPLVWLSFVLMSRDMEMSCDEKVIKELGSDVKKAYSASLLAMAVGKSRVSGCPLTFGEGNVKSRIKNILRYRKPALWVLVLAAVVAIIAVIGLTSNPKKTSVEASEKSLKPKVEAVKSTKNIEALAEEKLNIILSSPQSSSNPKDYILTHSKEYEDILKYGGEDALNYMLSQFQQGKVKNDLRGQIIMQLCKEILGPRNNVNEENLLPLEWYSELQIKEQTTLPDYVYDSKDPIEKLVYKTEIEKNQNMKYESSFLIVAPHIHGSYEEGNKLKVFATTYAATYQIFGKMVNEKSGSIVPVAITYSKNGDGSYTLEKYEQAQDGSEFMPSIKKFCTMPVSGKKISGLENKILDHYSNYDDIRKLIRENLVKHLKANGQTGVSMKERDDSIVPLT